MQHQDHVQLIHAGIPAQGGVRADLGSGSGAFTLALADQPGPGALCGNRPRLCARVSLKSL